MFLFIGESGMLQQHYSLFTKTLLMTVELEILSRTKSSDPYLKYPLKNCQNGIETFSSNIYL